MHPRLILAIGLAAGLAIGPVSAQTLQDDVINELRDQGFTTITVTRTWLGRTRIKASSKSRDREIIMNSRTGEVLRDYSEDLDGSGGGASGGDESGTGDAESGSGVGGENAGSGAGAGSGGGGGAGSGGDQSALDPAFNPNYA